MSSHALKYFQFASSLGMLHSEASKSGDPATMLRAAHEIEGYMRTLDHDTQILLAHLRTKACILRAAQPKGN